MHDVHMLSEICWSVFFFQLFFVARQTLTSRQMIPPNVKLKEKLLQIHHVGVVTTIITWLSHCLLQVLKVDRCVCVCGGGSGRGVCVTGTSLCSVVFSLRTDGNLSLASQTAASTCSYPINAVSANKALIFSSRSQAAECAVNAYLTAAL